MTQIHPTAIVHPKAIIGEDCVIGAWCRVGPEVVLGNGNILDSSVIIEGQTTVGDHNHFAPFAVIGTAPQDLKYKGEPTRLRIGSHNTIREYVTINLSNCMEEDTVVGDNNLLMAYVHVAHNCRIGSSCVIANTVQMAGHIVIDDHAIVGGITAIHQFVQIGSYCIIGGCSAVRMDIPPYTSGSGNPYKIYGLNRIGLTRKGFSNEQIAAIKDIYNLFYRSHLNVSQALAEIDKLGELTPEQQVFVDFVRRSHRGVSK
jgi:UDP-N-acetylglucosamine acyltransferase